MMDEHFSAVARRYRELRTTDYEAVQYILGRISDSPALGVDIGCGTGRYTQLLCEQLPRDSIVVAADSNLEMLRVLNTQKTLGGLIRPVASQAEDLPLRRRSADWITTFNAVHHFDLARFLSQVVKLLKPHGRLFIYTRTPEQNARSIWGRLFPKFAEKETRLRSESELREVINGTGGLVLESVERFRFDRTSTPERLREQAENAHYSTFRLYEREEFSEALRSFLKRLSGPVVRWTDENLMIVCRSDLP